MIQRTIRQLLIIAFLTGSFHPIQGFQSSFRFDRFTSKQGLSHNTVANIVQDQEGFLWFGTEDGLNRFDGYSFQVYKNIPGDTTSLLSSWIRCLFVGRDGTLWIGTTGLQRYDPGTNAFVRLRIDSHDAVGEVYAIAEDPDGSLWVGTTQGLWHVQHETHWTRYSHNPANPASLSSNVVYDILFDGKSMWVGTEAGTGRFDPGTGIFKPLDQEVRGAAPLRGEPVRHILRSRDGVLWFCSMTNGLLRLDPVSGKTTWFHPKNKAAVSLGSNITFAAAEDAKGRIWVGHLMGADIIDPANRAPLAVRYDPGDAHSLSGGRVYSVFCDRAGTIWLGTAGGGVSRYDVQRNRFGLFRGGAAAQYEGYSVFAILETTDGSVWLGSTNGLERFNRSSFRAVPASATITGLAPGRPQDVLALFQDREGFLWVGYREQRPLERIDLRSGTVRRYPLHGVRSIFQDRDGEFWIGFWFDGVARLDGRSGLYRLYRNNPSNPDSLRGGGVWTFHENPRGQLWMGTWGRNGMLEVFDKSTGRFRSIVPREQQVEHSAGVNVRAIVQDDDGFLWLGTWGNGLQRYNPQDGSFEYFYEQQGLPSNYVKALKQDHSGNLWVSTEKGLSRFDLRKHTFRNFSADDGLQGDMFLSGSACFGPSGMMYFGGDNGMNFFVPDSITDDPVPPPVVITGFRIFDKPQQPSSWRSSNISLTYDQDFISFEFVGLDYTNSARNQYAYMLEGFDRDWIQAGTRRYAAYTHLDGGTYTFRVRASNSDGVWNTEGASLTLTISPPFWNTWWFRISAIVITVVTISVGFRIRLRHQLALERLRQRIAGDLHDDVGTELSSIVLGSQYLARTLPLKESDRTQVENLGIIARNTHEMMRDIVWMLRSDNDTLDELVVKMREVAVRLLGGIHCTFNAPFPDESKQLQLETKRNVFLFYKEVLNNIVRHSGATTVTITLASLDGSLELVVMDNGRGFDQKRGTGSGLGNLRTRAETMKAELLIEPNPGSGTMIRLRCPTT